MSDYKRILPTEISIDQPLTSQLFDKLRQNPLAIASNSTTGDTPPKYEQPSCEESTATAESKDRLVAFRWSSRESTSAVAITENVETVGYKVLRKGVYGLHLYNVRSSGNIACEVYVNGLKVRDVTAASDWSLLTVEKGDIVYAKTLATGLITTTTYMYLYTNNPMGDMQLLGGYRANKIFRVFIHSGAVFAPQDDDGNVFDTHASACVIKRDIY